MELTLKEIEAIIEKRTGLRPSSGETYFRTYEAVIDAVSKEASKAFERSEGHKSNCCEWTPYYEEDEPTTAGYMQSGCPDEHGRAHEWMDGEGDPPGRWMKFCPFCGGKVAFVAQRSEQSKPGPIADPRGIVSTTNITLPPSEECSK